MSKLSNFEIAILGLLYEHHHYAYRLEEIMEKRAMNAWADLEFSSMDNALTRLEKINLVESRMRNVEDKEEIYYITDEGRKVLKDKINELLSNKSRIFYPIYMGLANMHFLSNEEIIQSLNLYLKSINERIGYLDNSIKIQEENNIPYNFIAISSHSIAVLKAERNWIEEFIQKIK